MRVINDFVCFDLGKLRASRKSAQHCCLQIRCVCGNCMRVSVLEFVLEEYHKIIRIRVLHRVARWSRTLRPTAMWFTNSRAQYVHTYTQKIALRSNRTACRQCAARHAVSQHDARNATHKICMFWQIYYTYIYRYAQHNTQGTRGPPENTLNNARLGRNTK